MDLFTEVVLEVFRLNGRLLAAGDAMSAPVGLTSARWQVLGAIEAEPLSVAQIGRAMGLTRQGVQRTADLLASEGVIEYLPNPQHKRAKLVSPTPKGRDMLARIGVIQAAWAGRIANGVDVARLAIALDVMRTLRAHLEIDGGDEP